MPAEKSNSKTRETRRSNKPLMEKRRRARINQSLTEIKSLILDAVKKDTSRHNKLEKADILEMTVKYLQNLQRQQLTVSLKPDHSATTKFQEGFDECASEVSRFLDKADELEPNVRSHLTNHLTTSLRTTTKKQQTSTKIAPSSIPCVNITTSTSTTPVPAFSSSLSSVEVALGSPTSTTSSQVQQAVVPAAKSFSESSDDCSNNGVLSCSDLQIAFEASMFTGLRLIPTRLASGEIAFILPTQHTTATVHALNSQVTSATEMSASGNSVSDTSEMDYKDSSHVSKRTFNHDQPSVDSESSISTGDNSLGAESPPSAAGSPRRFNEFGNGKNRIVFTHDEDVWRPW